MHKSMNNDALDERTEKLIIYEEKIKISLSVERRERKRERERDRERRGR